MYVYVPYKLQFLGGSVHTLVMHLGNHCYVPTRNFKINIIHSYTGYVLIERRISYFLELHSVKL